VLATYAARDGMLGDPDALGVLTGAGDVMARAAEPGIARVDAKPFCTARQALAAVEAARTARGELGDAPIAEIEVAVPAAYRAMVDQAEPGGRMTSIISALRQIALALTDDAGLYDVTRDDLTLPEGAAQLMAATHVVADDELTELYPEHFAARVRMRAADGGEAHCLVRDPLGARERPLGWADVREKHRRIGVRGERLAHTERLSRELGAGAGPAPARELLRLMTDPHPEAVT
jgi:2-methylcitrate dehydratase PrpD